MDLLNSLLTIIIFILLMIISYIFFNEFLNTCDLQQDEEVDYRKIKKKEIDCRSAPDMEMDYNHVRQRKVRRELEMKSKEITEIRKKAEDRFKQKERERESDIYIESDKEFIISLDYEINKLLAGLINLKRNNKILDDIEETIQTINSVYKVLNEETQKNNRIGRSHIKLNLLEEYKEILESLR